MKTLYAVLALAALVLLPQSTRAASLAWAYDTAVFQETYASIKGVNDGLGNTAWLLKSKDTNGIVTATRVLWLDKMGKAVATDQVTGPADVNIIVFGRSKLIIQINDISANVVRTYTKLGVSAVNAVDAGLDPAENVINSRQPMHDTRGFFSVVGDQVIRRYLQ